MAAAAAAAASAKIAREQKADKHLALLYTAIPKLTDTDFHDWSKKLRNSAYRMDWHDSILDHSAAPPAHETETQVLDRKNAYIIITDQCAGHPVADDLEQIPVGDARAAFQLVHNHFFRPTSLGKQQANTAFWNMSMASTDTDLSAFLALARRNRNVVTANGGTVSDEDLLNVILRGLLPEFATPKYYIEQLVSPNLSDCCARLKDFAAAQGLTNLTRGGNISKRNKTFSVDDGKSGYSAAVIPGVTYRGQPWKGGKTDCQKFHHGLCTRSDCKFTHPPSRRSNSTKTGASNTKVLPAPSTNLVLTEVDMPPSQFSLSAVASNAPEEKAVHCLFCQDTREPKAHSIADCPLFLSCEARAVELSRQRLAATAHAEAADGVAAATIALADVAPIATEQTLRQRQRRRLQRLPPPPPPLPDAVGKLPVRHYSFGLVDGGKASNVFARLWNNKGFLLNLLVAIAVIFFVSGVPLNGAEARCSPQGKVVDGSDIKLLPAGRLCSNRSVPVPPLSSTFPADPPSPNSPANFGQRFHKFLDARILVPITVTVVAASWTCYERLPSVTSSRQLITSVVHHLVYPGWLPSFTSVRQLITSVVHRHLVHLCQPVVHIECYLYGQPGSVQNHEWVCDTGTNRFVTNDRSDFVLGSERSITNVVSAGGGKVTSNVVGTVVIQSLDNHNLITCHDVIFLPQCGKKLIPMSVFDKKNCSLLVKNSQVTLLSESGHPILQGKLVGGLYYFHCKTVSNQGCESQSQAFFGLPIGKSDVSENSPEFAQRLLEAHCAFGHLNFTRLRKILSLAKGSDPDCPTCTIAKSKRQKLSKHPYTRSTRVNHRKFLDIGFTRNSAFCFQLAIDDYTRRGWLDVLTSKDQAFESFTTLQRQHDNDYAPYKLAFVKTDGEPLYSTPAWSTMCDLQGITHEYSGRYRHDQNGVVERGMGIIGELFRSTMIHGNAPESDIPEALDFANIIRNNAPTKANQGWTPLEKEAGMRLTPNWRLFRGPLFCLCYAHVYDEQRYKHAPRGIACVYLGYDPQNNQYKVKEWKSGEKYWTADVTMHPTRFPYRASPTRMNESVGLEPHLVSRVISDHNQPDSAERGALPNMRRSTRASQPSAQALRNIADVDSPPVELQSIECFVQHFGADPTSWSEAMASPYPNEWTVARLEEMNSFKHHGVLEVVPRSAARGKRIFKPKAVFKIKVNPPSAHCPEATINKFKYRLTIAAFTKMLIQGIDYEEKYASTVRWEAVKLLLAIACIENYDIVLFDIATFFLYGKLKEEIYMEQAEGWDTSDKPKADWICRLRKTMYGLPQAPHEAQMELKQTLMDNNQFRPTSSDDCIYIGQEQKDKYVALGAHVDDLPAVGTAEGLDKVRTTPSKKFKFTETVNPDVITGVQIQRDRSHRWLKAHQTHYSTSILKKYDMIDCIGVDTPMDPATARALMLLPTEPADPQALKEYQVLIGTLMWLRKTRLDLYYTLSLLSRFLKNATKQHLKLALGRPLRFLKRTVDYGLVFYPGNGDWILSGASDSDLAGDLTTSRSTMGFYACLGDFGAVLAGCKLERKICTSTGQAETYAFLSLVLSIEWLRGLLEELGYPMKDPTVIHGDNEGVLKQTTKAINHTAVKHYRIAQAYIRQRVEMKTILAKKVDSEYNASDIFTKALHSPLFLRHQARIMGPQAPPLDRD